jgi:hypothetical protein
MLNGHDQRAWAGLERRLRDDGAVSFLPVRTPLANRWTSPRWLPCAMAVIVPLLLLTLSVFDMRPSRAVSAAWSRSRSRSRTGQPAEPEAVAVAG